MNSIQEHRVTKPGDEDYDIVEEMIKKTGCANEHYAVQECYSENKDWRKCKEELAKFRKCMNLKRMENASR